MWQNSAYALGLLSNAYLSDDSHWEVQSCRNPIPIICIEEPVTPHPALPIIPIIPILSTSETPSNLSSASLQVPSPLPISSSTLPSNPSPPDNMAEARRQLMETWRQRRIDAENGIVKCRHRRPRRKWRYKASCALFWWVLMKHLQSIFVSSS